MSEPRKSAIQTEARRRAREKALEFRAREDQLEALAVDFFVAQAAVEAVDAELERSIAALRARAEQDAAKAQADADAAVQAMLGLSVPRNEVASRLGIPTRAVPKPQRASADDTAPSEDGEHVGEDEHPQAYAEEHAYQ